MRRNGCHQSVRQGCAYRARFSCLFAILAFIALVVCVSVIAYHVQLAGLAAGRPEACQDNLETIFKASREYQSAHGSLPPAVAAAGGGLPEMSWRVAILPYMGFTSVYKTL